MYYAISGIGWGRDTTIEEAVRHHVLAANWVKVKDTMFKSRKELNAWLEGIPAVWLAPDDAVGFVKAGQLFWEDADGSLTPATPDQLVKEPTRQ